MNQIPHLEEFSLELRRNSNNSLPIPNQIAPEFQFQFQLPRLKVLRLKSDIISSHPQIAREILNAAVNLKALHAMTNESEDFQFLDSIGKLHILKGATVEMNNRFFSAEFQLRQVQRPIFPAPGPAQPRLEILELDVDYGLSPYNPVSFRLGVSFLTDLFEASKTTLRTLKVQAKQGGFWILPGFEFPIFENLQKLSLCVSLSPIWIFSQGIRFTNIFPVVEFLGMRQNKKNFFLNSRTKFLSSY